MGPNRKVQHLILMTSLLAVCVGLPCVSLAQNPSAGRKYALLIGVRNYDKNELRNLPYTEEDIEALAKTFEQAGFRRVVVLSQTRGAQESRFLPLAANIRTSLRGLLEDRAPEDSIVVALAGHGVQFRGEAQSYFCPMDAKLSDRNTLIPLDEIFGGLKDCEAGLKLMLVDACRNDPQSDHSRARSQVNLESVTRPQTRKPPGGVAAFYSCSEGERAFESPELKHGVFFHYVIEAMSGKADFDKDRSISVDELVLYAKGEVPDRVKEEFGDDVRQMPELVGNTRGLAPLVTLARVESTSPSKPTAPIPGEANEEDAETLKRIGVALHAYHSKHGRFPPAQVLGPDGKTAHSWRVAILPYFGDENGRSLYDRYRFNEPWDSEHNKALLQVFPNPYAASNSEKLINAAFFAPVGKSTIFAPGTNAAGTRIEDVQNGDGASNTIMIVQAKREVPWTKPEDLTCESAEKLPAFGGIQKSGYWILLADGHAHFVTREFDAKTLYSLLTKNGGEPLPEMEDPDAETPSHVIKPSHVINLKLLGLTIHSYQSQHADFPAAKMLGPDGKTPHSWRVALLPFIDGGDAIYRRYRFDEPWDSANNIKLLAEIPPLYRSPDAKPGTTDTFYALPTGTETIFSSTAGKTVKLREIQDGLSNTIMLVETRKGIPWTKPEDVVVSSRDSIPQLGSADRNGFHAAFADGSYRFLEANLPAETLWAFFTKAGGDVAITSEKQ